MNSFSGRNATGINTIQAVTTTRWHEEKVLEHLRADLQQHLYRHVRQAQGQAQLVAVQPQPLHRQHEVRGPRLVGPQQLLWQKINS